MSLTVNSSECSDPPEKPPDCSSEAWQILEDVVNETESCSVKIIDSQNIGQNQEIITLEIMDVDQNGVVNLIEQEIPLIFTENPTNEINNADLLVLSKSKNIAETKEGEAKTINNGREGTDNMEEGDSIGQTKNSDIDSDTNKTKIFTKKRQRNSKNWKQNIRKQKRQSGDEYVNVKGITVPKRSVKEKTCCSNNCPFNCSHAIAQEERDLIHTNFWHLSDEKKLHFYSKHGKRSFAARKRTTNETSKKTFSYEYSLIVSGVKVRVCQEYFLNTLDISKQRIYYFFKKKQNHSTEIPITPLQGKHQKNIIPKEKKDEVRNHIKSFPTVPSHYCRSSSNKQYLERYLNVRRMYELYVQQTNEPVKFHMYENIFKKEFNMAFFKPKKDICDKCAEFAENKNLTEEDKRRHDEHIKRKYIGKQERENDRIRYKDDETVGVITFDLENTFSLPKSNVSKKFYKMKLSCYNFTAHCNRNNTVYNALWHEGLCGRAGVHIASALIKILKAITKDNPNIKKLILWSDSCVPQNKNSIMSFAIQCFLNSPEGDNIEIIEQKFGEPGHGNVQEIDSAHSCIERWVRHLEIWTPVTLIRLLLSIPKSWKLKFKVIQMKASDYFDYQSLSTQFTYNCIPYTKVKNLIYEKTCAINIKYKLSFEGPTTTVKLKYARRVNLVKEVVLPKIVPQIREKKVVLNPQKKKHLEEMIPQMPEEDKRFYYALLGIRN